MTAPTFTPRFFAIINCVHPSSKAGGIGHALANVRVAFECGADGVFLHGKNVDPHALGQIYDAVRKQHPGRYIGINMPQIDPMCGRAKFEALIKGPFVGVNAIWLNNLPPIRPQITAAVEIFTDVCGRHQRNNLSPNQQIQIAFSLKYIPTIGGNYADELPPIGKVQILSTAIDGRGRLAITTGIDISNAQSVKSYGVSDFIVCHGVSKMAQFKGETDNLTPEKVRELADNIHAST